MLVGERRKHVHDGLLYTYVYVLLYRSALFTAFPLLTEIFCTRANKTKIELVRISKNIFLFIKYYSSQFLFNNFNVLFH
jgi:hypothetical protein